MSLKAVSVVLVAAAIASVVPASADETGLAGIHDMRREGRRVCFTDHFHSGSGNGASKKAAIGSAVGSWQGFTALEYGTSWGQWSNAGSKRIGCAPAGGGQWSCQIEGRPCK